MAEVPEIYRRLPPVRGSEATVLVWECPNCEEEGHQLPLAGFSDGLRVGCRYCGQAYQLFRPLAYDRMFGDLRHLQEVPMVQVICLNDFPQHVFQGTEQAARKLMKLLQQEHFAQRRDSYYSSAGTPEQNYKDRCHWHIKQVPLSAAVPVGA